jgi:hypothetical protein
VAATAGKRQVLRQELEPVLRCYLEGEDSDRLRAYILAHSGLPGPRANLELAQVFAELVGQVPAPDVQRAEVLLQEWTGMSAAAAPAGDPQEFLPFCGAWALGCLAAAHEPKVPETLNRLRELAADERWRLREAVANGLQALLAAHPAPTLAALTSWIQPGAWLEMRAVAAALAEPSLLGNTELTRQATALHHLILDQVEAAQDASPDFRTLRQALGYTVSVVVAAEPQAGATLLDRLARSTHLDLRWILRENLKKARLARACPDLVQALRERL